MAKAKKNVEEVQENGKDVANNQMIVMPGTPGALVQPICEVKLKTNITTAALIKTAIFQLKDKLFVKRNHLNEKSTLIQSDIRKADEDVNSIKEKIKTGYKDDKLISSLTPFHHNGKLEFKCQIQGVKDDKMDIFVNIVSNVGYGNPQNTGFSKVTTEKAPKNLLDAIKKVSELKKELNDNHIALNATQKKIDNLPHIKDKIEATLVTILMSGKTNGTADVIAELHQAIEAENDDVVMSSSMPVVI